MALYSFHGQIIGRGKSIRMNKDGSVAEKAASRRSTSVAAAAYRAGARLVDTRTGVAYDYTRKGGVVHTEILLPPNAPGRYNDRQTLWNAVEQAERQNNAQLSRELRIALPSEFSREENIALVRDFVQRNFVAKGMCADIAYHVKDKKGDDHNPHVHIMLTMRPMTKGGNWWQTKSRKEYITDRNGNRIMGANGEWKSRNVDLTGWNDKTLYVSWRAQWAEACNARYAAKGLPYRIDHRSYIAQGIDRQPTLHMGKEATALERKGVSTEKGNYNRAIAAYNEVAELGIEPTGLWETVQAVFERTKVRQRISKKVRVSEPTLAGVVRPLRPEQTAERQARAVEGVLSGGQSRRRARSQDDQRRTDAPLHGAVRQGAPCTPKEDESPLLSSEKKPQRRLEAPPAGAGGARQPAPDEVARQEAIRRSNSVRGGIRHAAGTNNFMVTRGARTYEDLLAGIYVAEAEYNACKKNLDALNAEIDNLRQLQQSAAQVQHHSASKDAVNHLRAEIEKLQQLQIAVTWAHSHRAVTEQFEKLKLFPRKFYKAHKLEIDRYRYAVKQLAEAGITLPVEPDAFAQKLKALEAERDALVEKQRADVENSRLTESAIAQQIKALAITRNAIGQKLAGLREELRMWCACEVYMRELLNLPKPPNIPDFSVPAKAEPQKQVQAPAQPQQQKAPATKHRHDDRGR